jgi:hypothetical protein
MSALLGGSTITLTVNSVAYVMSRVNQDSYATEYRYSDSTMEFRANIRHTESVPKAGGVKTHRHNVEFIQTVFGTGGAPDIVRQWYNVYVGPYNDSKTTAQLFFQGTINWMDSDQIQTDLLNWLG